MIWGDTISKAIEGYNAIYRSTFIADKGEEIQLDFTNCTL